MNQSEIKIKIIYNNNQETEIQFKKMKIIKKLKIR